MNHVIPNWPAPKQVKAFGSTRVGGFSQGPYQGLNLGMHVGDDAATVERNRSKLVQDANMPSLPVWLNQTHSNVVAVCEESTSAVVDADGVVTSTPQVVCSVMTADCLPVLITNTAGTQVAAVHAGWRGLANGIIENALKKMSGEPLIWLGPAIGPSAFEVGEDVLTAFVSMHSDTEQAFTPREGIAGKWLADMDLITRIRLNDLGITQIFSSNLCTFNDAERFYSYRRDGITGRQASFIWIEE